MLKTAMNMRVLTLKNYQGQNWYLLVCLAYCHFINIVGGLFFFLLVSENNIYLKEKIASSQVHQIKYTELVRRMY